MKRLSIVLYSDAVKETIAFYEKLGFTLNSQLGDIDWCAMQWNDVSIMISKPNEHLPFTSAKFTGSLYFQVENATKLWEEWKDWASIEYPIEDFDYGMREFALWDNNGYMLQFGEILITPEEKPRIVGIGGTFIKSKDPKSLYKWYQEMLEMDVDAYGTVFQSRKVSDNHVSSYTQWSFMKEDSTHFDPSQKEFMLNYRVINLKGFIAILASKAINLLGEIQSFEYGHFAHIMDPEGNKIELWEPIEKEFEKIIGSRIKD